jgi:S-layer protein
MIDYTSQINALYQAIQFKPGSAIEIAQYNASLNSGALTLAGVQSLIEADPYTINYVNPVIREYQAAFGRVPDQAGLGYWAGIVAANPAALLTLGTIFANSAEFNARYGATATTVANVALVGALYANVLGRQGDQAGITYWAKSGLTAAQLLTAFAQSPEFIADVATPIVTYENLEAAGTPATTGSLFALAPPSAGGSFTLTTGADNPPLVANNNTISGTFNGAGATLTVGDTINGGTTTGNTLTLVDLTTSGAADPTTVGAVTISDIQTVIIQSGESINANTASSPAGFTGLTQLNVTESNNGANSTITAATTNISVTDQSQRGGALSVEGGLNVSVATTETTSGPGSITVGDITAPKGTVTITATAAPTASGDFDMGAITVYGGTVVSITQTEAGSVNNTTFGGAVTVNGGAATTSVTVDQTAPVVKSATVAGVADGQVTITDANESGGAKAGVITTVVLDGLNGPNSIYDSALVNLTVNDSAANTGINIVEGAFATPATTLNLSLNNNAGLFVNDSGAKYTAVNMTVGALASTVTLFDFAAKTLTIAGTGGTLTFSSNATTLTSINASTDTGGVVFTDTWAGAVVTGGSGNDVVTLNAALTPASGGSINLGGGNNALLAGNSGSIASGVAIDGGTGGTNTIAATLVNAGNAASIKDFQIVDVSGYGSGNGGGTGSLDAFLLGAPVTGVAISTASTAQIATLQNLAAAVTVTDTYNTDNSLLTLTHAAGSATNSLAVNFAGTSTAATFETLNTLTSTGDTTIAISSGGASTQAGYYNAIDNLNETDNHLTTITITGAQAFKLFNVSTDGVQSTTTASSLTTIDGHAATGALTINAGGTIPLDNVTYTGLTIFGGTGGDTITNSAANGVITEGATASTLHNALTVWGSGATINDQASAGVDSIFLDGVNVSQTANLGSGGTAAASTSVFVNNATTTSTVLDTVNFGSGIATVTDTLTYQAAAGTNTAAINGNLLALTGALHAEILAFFAPIANPPGALGAATSVNSAQTFDQAVHYAESPTVNTVTWFQYANNTYIEDSGSTPTSTVGAEVVKITGLVDLSHATIGNGHLTFA